MNVDVDDLVGIIGGLYVERFALQKRAAELEAQLADAHAALAEAQKKGPEQAADA